MRLWLSKNSEVPAREQLATQIMLGILSEDLKQGQRLPSTRELAHRLRIHPNTVSAAYRDLARRGWVEFRKGSGIYVRARNPEAADAGLELDQLIATFFQTARAKGFALREIQSRLTRWLEVQPPDHFLVIEPDEELRNILVTEIREATGLPTVGTGLEGELNANLLAGAAPVVLFHKAEQVRALLPPRAALLLAHSRSVTASLAERVPISPDALITVVSHWPEFTRWARAVLVAAGVNPDALDCRDARDRGWQSGLRLSSVVIADAFTARSLPDGCRAHVFRLLADDSLAELRSFKESLTPPAP